MKKIKIKQSKVGSLHKALGIPQDKKIPASKLKDKPGDSAAMKKKKLFARNSKSWKHGNGDMVWNPQNDSQFQYQYPNIDPNEYYDPSLFNANQTNPQSPYGPENWHAPYSVPNSSTILPPNNATRDQQIQQSNSIKSQFKYPLLHPSFTGGNPYFQQGFGELGNSIFDFTKGFLDLSGNNRMNRQTLANERRLNRQTADSNLLSPPVDTQYNRNPAYFAFGGNVSINKYKSDFPNSEVEGPEVGQTPQGLIGQFNGPSHENGGIQTNLPQGTQIFSDRLKHPILKKSYAKIAKKYSTEKDFETLENQPDDISKTTAMLNISLKNKALDNLFMEQESNKAKGVHGKQKFATGGTTGKFHAYPSDIEDLEKKGLITRFTWQDINDIADTQHKGKEGVYGDISGNPKLMDEFYLRHQWVKPQFKEQFKRDFDPTNPSDVKWMQQAYDKYFFENTGQHYYSGDKGKDPYGFDGKFGEYTYSMPLLNQRTEWTGPLGDRPPYELDKNNPYIYNNIPGFTKIDPQTPQPKSKADDKIQLPSWNIAKSNDSANFTNFDIPVPGLNNYLREPIATTVLHPEYINPRYLDVQPQLNEVSRAKNSFTRNLGSRTSTDVANILQSDTNAYNAMNQIYGQKYNYDQQQDSAAQQFNASAKMNTDLQNLQERNNFMDKIASREGIIDTQKRVDAQSNIQNHWNKEAYNQKYQFAKDSFAPLIDSNGKIFGYTPLVNEDPNQYKCGGKIKIKMKKRK